MTSFRKFLLPATVFLLVFGAGAAFLVAFQRYRIGELRKAISVAGIGQAYALERQLDRSLSATVALSVLVHQSSETVMRNFDEVADHMLDRYKGISSLQLAPNGIVTRIYPLAGKITVFPKAVGKERTPMSWVSIFLPASNCSGLNSP